MQKLLTKISPGKACYLPDTVTLLQTNNPRQDSHLGTDDGVRSLTPRFLAEFWTLAPWKINRSRTIKGIVGRAETVAVNWRKHNTAFTLCESRLLLSPKSHRKALWWLRFSREITDYFDWNVFFCQNWMECFDVLFHFGD